MTSLVQHVPFESKRGPPHPIAARLEFGIAVGFPGFSALG